MAIDDFMPQLTDAENSFCDNLIGLITQSSLSVTDKSFVTESWERRLEIADTESVLVTVLIESGEFCCFAGRETSFFWGTFQVADNRVKGFEVLRIDIDLAQEEEYQEFLRIFDKVSGGAIKKGLEVAILRRRQKDAEFATSWGITF